MTATYIVFFQYSLLHRKEGAHDDSIWTVAWGKVTRKEQEKENGENHDENSRYMHLKNQAILCVMQLAPLIRVFYLLAGIPFIVILLENSL